MLYVVVEVSNLGDACEQYRKNMVGFGLGLCLHNLFYALRIVPVGILIAHYITRCSHYHLHLREYLQTQAEFFRRVLLQRIITLRAV